MIEVYGDLWTYPADWRIITTNGFVKKNGEAVMGRGCAKEANDKFGIAKMLGAHIKSQGNILWAWPDGHLIFFPVKHNGYEKADIDLIRESRASLYRLTIFNVDKTFLLPRPGCGNGQLKWEDVKPILLDLPDNVKVITHEPK